jgi:branched-chain amino acid transport system ATP-binding protein
MENVSYGCQTLRVASRAGVRHPAPISVHGSADKLKHDPAVVAAYLGGSH